MNKCITCGQETKNKKYCSNKCKYADMSQKKKLCINCGEPVKRCETIYCSKKCYQEHRKQEFETSVKYNNCIICGQKTRNQKYCSMKCLGKDKSRIETAINNLPNETYWTKEEQILLKENYGVIPLEELSELLHRKKETIIKYANEHNIMSQRLWTSEDIDFLMNNLDDIDKVAEKLCRSKSSIVNKLATINGFRNENGYSIISPQEYVTNYLREQLNYPCISEFRVGQYTLDLVLYNLDIEIQGSYWHGDERLFSENKTNKQEKTIAKDERRKEYLEMSGYKVIYIWEYDIISNPEKIKAEIKGIIENHLSTMSEEEKIFWMQNNTENIQKAIKKEQLKIDRANKRMEYLNNNLKYINRVGRTKIPEKNWKA